MTSLLIAESVRIEGRLEPTDLRCQAGELVAIIGPNGAGKTSLLRALAGIELDGGMVLVEGEDIAAASISRRTRLLAFLPATRSLVWPISARDVISMGMAKSAEDRIAALLDSLELRDLASRAVNSLSTGERTRVLLARSMAARPKLMLLDEPLANLEPYWVLQALRMMREASQSGSAVVASLHDLSQLASFDRAILVNDGRILVDAPPSEVLDHPKFSAAFRVERHDGAWRVSPSADPQSSQ